MQSVFHSIRVGLKRGVAILAGKGWSAGSPSFFSGTSRAMQPTDVRNLYRILLGRLPENDVVVQDQVGKKSSVVLQSFIQSEEFRLILDRMIADPDDAGDDTLTVNENVRQWAFDFFNFNGTARSIAADVHDSYHLLIMALGQHDLSKKVDAYYGSGTVAEILKRSVIVPSKSLPQSTNTNDLTVCYELFLQRQPESASVVEARPHSPLIDAIMGALLSEEFYEKVVGPALDGQFDGRAMPSPRVIDWMHAQMGVDSAGSKTIAELIAMVIRRPDVQARLSTSDATWPAAEVVKGLKFSAGTLSTTTTNLTTRLQRVTTNMDIGQITDIVLAQDRFHVSYTATDPWLILRPTGDALTGDLIRLRFRTTMASGAVMSRLYLDYGQGFSEANSIGLFPDPQGYQHAMIAAPQKVIAMRWDPSAEEGQGTIGMMEAHPMSVETYLEHELQVDGPEKASHMMERLTNEANSVPNAPLAMTLTRLLSPTVDASYAAWILRNEPQGTAGRILMRKQLANLSINPVISIIVPTYNTPEALLVQMIESVREQVYPNWQLCIADDASTEPHVRSVLERYAAQDARICITLRKKNGHICAASNSAMESATGEWIALLDHDDLLAPHALLAMVQAVEGRPDALIVYSDEDKINESGQRSLPYFKPEYSPELLLAQNYFNHLTMFRASAVRDAGGWRIGFEGSQDHDLILRVIESAKAGQIVHVPKVLYHWRAIAGSTALGGEQKDYTVNTGIRAVEEHLQRTKRPAKVDLIARNRHYRVRYAIPEPRPLVSLLIPTRDKAEILKVAVDSIIEKTTYAPYEIIVLDNGSVEKETFDLFATWKNDPRIRIVAYDKPFNYSAINNFGVSVARGSVIGLVNNDVEVITPEWLDEMTAWALRPEIGCVGAKLYYPDKSLQHGGVIIGLGGVAGHSHKYFAYDSPGYFNRLQVHQNLSAVTAACLLVRREVYEEVGGLEEILSVAFNDVDFCLRVREAGYRNLFTPFAELFHHESISRGAEDSPEKMARAEGEVKFMKERWQEKLQSDPFYSPNLTYDREDFSLSTSGPVA